MNIAITHEYYNTYSYDDVIGCNVCTQTSHEYCIPIGMLAQTSNLYIRPSEVSKVTNIQLTH